MSCTLWVDALASDPRKGHLKGNWPAHAVPAEPGSPRAPTGPQCRNAVCPACSPARPAHRQIGELGFGRVDLRFGRIHSSDSSVARTVLCEARRGLAIPPAWPLAAEQEPVHLVELERVKLLVVPNRHAPALRITCWACCARRQTGGPQCMRCANCTPRWAWCSRTGRVRLSGRSTATLGPRSPCDCRRKCNLAHHPQPPAQRRLLVLAGNLAARQRDECPEPALAGHSDQHLSVQAEG